MSFFRKFIFIFALLLLIQNLVSQQLTEPLKVGLYNNYPKVFQSDDGKARGIFPEILHKIASKEGWQLQFDVGSWDECLQKLQNRHLDIMVDVAISDERVQLYDFNRETVLTSWGCLYSKHKQSLDSILDLQNKTIAVMKSSILTNGRLGIYELVKRFGVECEFLEVDSYNEVFELVRAERADVGVVNRFFGAAFAKEYQLYLGNYIFQPSQLRFAFPKDAEVNKNIIPIIDEYLEKWKQQMDSEYYDILSEYELYPSKSLPIWIKIVVTVSITLILIFVIFYITLKWQIKKQTKLLKKYQNELENLVEERTKNLESKTKELEIVNEQLQEADKLKSIFLASMSHELRTPLNSIIGFTGILLMGMVGDLSEEQRKQLQIIDKNSKHLLQMINEILDISKIEADKVELALEQFDACQVVGELVETLEPKTKEKELYLQTNMPAKLEVFLDKRRFKQIILNLLSNAIKFTEKGGITINLEIKDGNKLQLTVSDTGIGLDPKSLKKIFQPFQQIDSTLTKKYDGTGLGLHLTNKIVTLFAGQIEVKSKLGKGTTFQVILPIEYKVE